MQSGPHCQEVLLTVPDLVRLLEQRRDQIVASLVSEVQRKDLSPPGVARSLLVDHIPRFLDEIRAELTRVEELRVSQDAIDTSKTARQHGEQRWNLGYDLDALIREYGILRHCILQAAKDAGTPLTIDDFDVLAKCLSVGVAEAATEYARFRDEQLNAQKANLEFLAEAGQLLSSSLDTRSTLGRLTGLVVPRVADWCAVHLDGHGTREMSIAHVEPTKVALLREIYEKFPSPTNSTSGYMNVIRTGKPRLARNIDPAELENFAQSPEHLALLQTINACSWIIVPLRVQANTFGALTLAYSDSGRHYTDEDLVLAGELAGRAAVAIDNARLYDLSQRERSRVEAATRAKDEFVAMVSHELRTPLSAILGWIRLMQGALLPDTTREHAFEVIERNANALNQLVADLLDISKVVTGKIRINPAQVDLANIVEMAIEAMRPAADSKRIQITTDLNLAPAPLRGDGDRLQQVVWNLLSNAVKFTPKNGAITVSLQRVNSDIQLRVEDSGEGISEEFLPHVFGSFRQSDSSAARAHAGLGIGLSIAKHIVELHGGSIVAESPGPGRGATFVVKLPITALVSTTIGISAGPATREPAVDLSLPAGLDGIRVLLVEDDPDARELITYVLQSAGIEARSTSSAAEALAQLESYLPHVIISDIGMPGEDGYALIRRIRTLPFDDKKSIPAIALTAFARNEDRTRALVEGFNLHIAKPVEPGALVRAVADLAGHARR